VFGSVRGDSEAKAAGAGCCCQLANYIAMRPHACSVPGSHIGGIHGEAVAVLANGDNIAGTGTDEEIDPGIGIEVLGFEHGDKIFVAEGGLRTVGCYVMFESLVAGDIHVAGVPLISVCRNGINAPMEKYAKLCVAKPIRRTVLRE